jgi:hypothetical protein
VFVAASQATIEGLLVRDTRPLDDGTFGRGVSFQSHPTEEIDTVATMRGSIVEHSVDVGILVGGSEVTLEGVSVRDTVSAVATGQWGAGILAQALPERARRSKLELRWSEVEDSQVAGVLVGGSDATIEGSVVRRTLPATLDDYAGRGILVQDAAGGLLRGSAIIRSSLIEDNAENGIFVGGADVELDGVRVHRSESAPPANQVSRGINVQLDMGTGSTSTARIRHSLVEASVETGIFVAGAEAEIESTLVRGTLPTDGAGKFGDGVAFVVWQAGDTRGELRTSNIDGNARAAFATFGAVVSLGSNLIQCSPVSLDGEQAGDVFYELTDLGGNACGCGAEQTTCQVLSSSLAPPQAAAE